METVALGRFDISFVGPTNAFTMRVLPAQGKKKEKVRDCFVCVCTPERI